MASSDRWIHRDTASRAKVRVILLLRHWRSYRGEDALEVVLRYLFLHGIWRSGRIIHPATGWRDDDVHRRQQRIVGTSSTVEERVVLT